MQIIITGGAGFLGQRLGRALVKSAISFDELLLVDKVKPELPGEDARIKCQQVDLLEPDGISNLITKQTSIIFHLAAVVSSQAESDFDLGWKVNLDITRRLLEVCRHTKPGIRFVFASSVAVYGGTLPALVLDTTALTPHSSYGTQKAMAELLVNDYSRKGFVEGTSLRLPTICIRPGRPNQAASSFVSSIIREPLNGETAICPVSPALSLWLSSPDTVINNIIHASTLPATALEGWRTINLPGISVTVREMLDSLLQVTDEATLARVQFREDPAINRIVSSWPGAIDTSNALQLGFKADKDFGDFISQFMKLKSTA